MTKVLVTGGCGFIGSNLVDSLIEKNLSVNVIDNMSSDSDEFYHNDKAKYFHNDITDLDAVIKAMEGCEYVFHLAAESRIGPSIENPAKACLTNVVGTCNILTAARDLGVKSVVYSSTSACYGLSEKMPQHESDAIDNLNPYSSSKYAGEDLMRMFHKLWGLNTVSLRYFNVYGERMPSRGQYAPVIGIFLRQQKAGETLTIVGDGEQKRDFIHVADVVNANILASQNHSCWGNVYNIGRGQSYTINEIASWISDSVVHIAPRAGEARNTLAGTSAFENASGWKPLVSLRDWVSSKVN
jgi:UDP-glucose 4-epimerase